MKDEPIGQAYFILLKLVKNKEVLSIMVAEK